MSQTLPASSTVIAPISDRARRQLVLMDSICALIGLSRRLAKRERKHQRRQQGEGFNTHGKIDNLMLLKVNYNLFRKVLYNSDGLHSNKNRINRRSTPMRLRAHVLFGFFGASVSRTGLHPRRPDTARFYSQSRGSFASPEKRASAAFFTASPRTPLHRYRVQRARRKNPHPTAEKHRQPRPGLCQGANTRPGKISRCCLRGPDGVAPEKPGVARAVKPARRRPANKTRIYQYLNADRTSEFMYRPAAA